MVYSYPKFDRTKGFLWNTAVEMERLTGLKFWNMDDIIDGTPVTLYFFGVELTPEQKAILDDLVAQEGGYPPPEDGETVFEIDDLWELMAQIAVSMGLNPDKVRLRFGNVDTEGHTTKIRLYCGKNLSKKIDKDKVTAAYANLIREV